MTIETESVPDLAPRRCAIIEHDVFGHPYIREAQILVNFLNHFLASSPCQITEAWARKHFQVVEDNNLVWSEFDAIDDSLAYSILIESSVVFCMKKKLKLLDLGIGSGIPTIRAIDRLKSFEIGITGLDHSSIAVNCCKSNFKKYNEQLKIEVYETDMVKHLNDYEAAEFDVIVSNPPYIPTPRLHKNINRHTYDGGIQGTRYLEFLLENDKFKKGAIFGIQWSSLSNPTEIISVIEKAFEVLEVKVYWTPFGKITSQIKVKTHLFSLREKGISFFTDQGRYLFISTILMKK